MQRRFLALLSSEKKNGRAGGGGATDSVPATRCLVVFNRATGPASLWEMGNPSELWKISNPD